MADEDVRNLESSAGPLPANLFGYAPGLKAADRTVPNLSRQSEWTPLPIQQLRDVEFFYQTNPVARACSQFLKNKICGSGLQLQESTPIFTGEKREAFKEFLKTAWIPFANELIDQFICYGFTATSWAPHETFVGKPVTIDIPNTRPMYRFNHQKELEFRYLVDDTSRLVHGLFGDDGDSSGDDGGTSSSSSNSSDEDGYDSDGNRMKRRRAAARRLAKAKRHAARRLKRKQRNVRADIAKDTREPWTHFRDKPTIHGRITSPIMSVLGDVHYATVALELMMRGHAQRVNMPLIISKKSDQTAAALSIASDALTLQTSLPGLSTNPADAGPGAPGGGGGGGGGMPNMPGRFSLPDCPPIGSAASRLDARAASQIQAAKTSEMIAWLRNRGIPVRMGMTGGIASSMPGTVRLQPNEQVERPPDFKDPPKILEFLHRVDEMVYAVLGVPMSLVNRDSMNVTLSKSDSTTKDSASERLRETVANLGASVLAVLNKQYERIYMGHFVTLDITNIGSSDSDDDDSDDEGTKRTRTNAAAFKNRCQFSFNGLVKMEDVQMFNDMGLIDYKVYKEYASSYSGIPLANFRLFPKQPQYTIEGFIPSPEDMAAASLQQGKADALVAHAMPQKATMAKSASGKGTFPIQPRSSPPKSSLEAIDSTIAELRNKRRKRSPSPQAKKKAGSKKKKTDSGSSKSKKKKKKASD